MENILEPYKLNGYFDFYKNESLIVACTAPKNNGGVYMVYNINEKEEDLIYIGSTGWVDSKGAFHIRKGGMYDRLVNGKQFDAPRKLSWPQKMKTDKINLIRVKWYVTFNEDLKHIPAFTEANCLQKYFEDNGSLPFWNTDF